MFIPDCIDQTSQRRQSVAEKQHPHAFVLDPTQKPQSELSGCDIVVCFEMAMNSSQRKLLTTLFPVTQAPLQLFNMRLHIKHQITKQTSCGVRPASVSKAYSKVRHELFLNKKLHHIYVPPPPPLPLSPPLLCFFLFLQDSFTGFPHHISHRQ